MLIIVNVSTYINCLKTASERPRGILLLSYASGNTVSKLVPAVAQVCIV